MTEATTDNVVRRQKSMAEPRTFGYARVSSADQNLARQIDALGQFGVPSRRIYTDKASGANFDRPGYRRLIRTLRSGDTLVVGSIDRLGRNYAEINDEWRRITSDKGAHIVVLDMPLLDTRVQPGDLVGELIASLVLQIFSYMAQAERESIKRRQAEGIAAAKARGTRFGRPRIVRPQGWEDVLAQRARGEITRAEAAERLGISVSTLDNWAKESRASNTH